MQRYHCVTVLAGMLACVYLCVNSLFTKRKLLLGYKGMMEFVYIIIALQMVQLQYAHSHQCEPCEENTKCEIVYISEYTNDLPTKYFWKRDGQDVATCYTGEDSECIVYPDLIPHFKATIHLESGTVRSSVVLFNVTRASGSLSSESEWSFFSYDDVTLKLVYTCQIKIFKKIDNATCTYETSKKGLRITCTSRYVYPKSCCLFNISLDQTPYQLQLTPVLNHTVERSNLLYYSTVCTYVIPTDTLSPGFWNFNTTIFPDIHKDGKHCTSCHWEQTFRFNLTIEYPVVSLTNCTNAVDEGSEIICVCQREDKSEIKTSVYWGKQGDDIFSRSAVLRVTARKNNTGFTCTAVNEFGWQTTVKYSIAINSQPTVRTKGCPIGKPNICSMQCYSHDEFCLNGIVYSCEDAEPDKKQEWCQSRDKSAIEAMISPSCERACQSLKFVQTSEDIHTWKIVAIISIVSCGIILFVLFYIKGMAIKMFLIKILKRSKTPDNMYEAALNSSEAPSKEIFENVSDAGITCKLIVLDQCPIEISIFEDLSADEFKNLRLNSKQNIDDYNVVVRYPNGTDDVMEDEEEFGAKRLEECESVQIVEKRSKKIAESEVDLRRRKMN